MFGTTKIARYVPELKHVVRVLLMYTRVEGLYLACDAVTQAPDGLPSVLPLVEERGAASSVGPRVCGVFKQEDQGCRPPGVLLSDYPSDPTRFGSCHLDWALRLGERSC
jgi:hypothetical protein